MRLHNGDLTDGAQIARLSRTRSTTSAHSPTPRCPSISPSTAGVWTDWASSGSWRLSGRRMSMSGSTRRAPQRCSETRRPLRREHRVPPPLAICGREDLRPPLVSNYREAYGLHG